MKMKEEQKPKARTRSLLPAVASGGQISERNLHNHPHHRGKHQVLDTKQRKQSKDKAGES
jgi:hypothetical protein